MADEEKQEAEKNDQNKEQKPQAKPGDGKGQLLQWIIVATVIILLAVVGYFLGSALGYRPKAAQAGSEPATEAANESQPNLLAEDGAKGQNEGWFYDLDPVATNLSDPGSTRYVRAVLTFEMSPEADKEKGTQFLDERKPVIANILNIYFAGLAIDEINSDKDMRRIQFELLETLNDTLYKDSKPLIRQILFKEFGVQ